MNRACGIQSVGSPRITGIRFICNSVETIQIEYAGFNRFVFEVFPVMPVGLLPEVGTVPLDGIFLGKVVIVEFIYNFVFNLKQ